MCSSFSPQQIHEEIQELPWALAFPKPFSRHPLDCCCCSALQPRGSKGFAFPFTGSSSCLPHGPNSPHLEEAQVGVWVSAKIRQRTTSLSQFTYLKLNYNSLEHSWANRSKLNSCGLIISLFIQHLETVQVTCRIIRNLNHLGEAGLNFQTFLCQHRKMFHKTSESEEVMFAQSNCCALPISGKIHYQTYPHWHQSTSALCLKGRKISPGRMSSRSSKRTGAQPQWTRNTGKIQTCSITCFNPRVVASQEL